MSISLPVLRHLSRSGSCFKVQYRCQATKMSILFEKVIEANIALPGIDIEAKRRVFEDLYCPVYSYIKSKRDSQASSKPLFVGLSAPQGCGKTTLVEVFRQLTSIDGLNCVSMSLDDFYLTGASQDELAIKHPENSLLKFRGNAGSHDISLLNSTLDSLLQPSSMTTNVSIPRYDKSLRGGRGDRSASDFWTTIQKPVDIVLFEGWMLGFTPILNIGSIQNPNIVAINEYLKQYQTLHYLFDAWIVLALENVDCVYRWRLEAEHKMKESGKPGLTDTQVEDFVARFMPAYHTYLPGMYDKGPERRADDVPIMMITVDNNRKPVSTKFL